MLSLGFWMQAKPAMILSLLMTVANIHTVFLPMVLNALTFLAVLPVAGRSFAGVNAGLFLVLALARQVWQVRFRIEGAAAN